MTYSLIVSEKGKRCNFKTASTLFPNYSIDFFKIYFLLKRKITNVSADFDEKFRSY